MSNPLSELPELLVNENGGSYGFVCIWRKGQKEDSARKCTVGDFLAKSENQSGSWYIDGGWGGPPGPIRVDWDGNKWVNAGFARI